MPWVFDDDFEIGNMLKPGDTYKTFDYYGLCEKEFMKQKAKMEAPMAITQKMGYVEFDLEVYFNGPYIILKHDKADRKAVKVYIGTDTEKVKLQAFCIGLKRLYYEVYKDIFNDKVNVISTFTDGTKTTVMFDDGTDVSCQLHKGDTYIPEAGFAICLCKKIFGSISNVHKMLECCDYAERRKKVKEQWRKRRKLETQKRIEKEKLNFEEQVQYEIVRLRIHQEALKRLGWDECEDI